MKVEIQNEAGYTATSCGRVGRGGNACFHTFELDHYRTHSIDETEWQETRPDTRLPKSRAGGQGPYLRSLDQLGKNSEVQKQKS